MSFSFGFSGDDVDDEMNDGGVQEQTSQANGAVQADERFVGLPAREHLLDDLVGSFFFVHWDVLMVVALLRGGVGSDCGGDISLPVVGLICCCGRIASHRLSDERMA